MKPLVIAGGFIAEISEDTAIAIIKIRNGVSLDDVEEGQLFLDSHSKELVTRLGDTLLRYIPSLIQHIAPRLQFNTSRNSQYLCL
ncbi:MAG: hypothetical protein BWK79_00130 [Beggiatoa sp. IS2]|nr:MAG: hypothetical protein BWK78_00020 [Thiotrichaceae bacterium IS1]OQW96061.1 MAG: hypothetical protein BWK79_00130 [Beggiatoa sp. IS2]